MSTATAFVFPRSFPFCVEDLSGYTAADYIGNLTLAQVMSFFWNLETFTITTAGTAGGSGGTVDCTGSIVLNPPSSSSPFATGQSTSTWFGSGTSGAFSSFPAIRTPRARLCPVATSSFGNVGMFYGWAVAANTPPDFSIIFGIGTDPSNSDKYRIYYQFTIRYAATSGSGTTLIQFQNPANTSGPVLNSGIFSFGSLSFNWEATDISSSTSRSGLNMSASSSDYTY